MNKLLSKIQFKGDKTIWGVAILLMVLSVIFVYTSTSALAFKSEDGNTISYLFEQSIKVICAIFVMYIIQWIPWKIWYNSSFWFLIICIILLILVQFAGDETNEAKRWLTLPIIGLKFQPSELAKIAIIIHTAKILSDFQLEKGFDNYGFYNFIPIVIAIGLIFIENFSTSAIISFVIFILFILGRVSWKTIAKIISPIIISLFLALALVPYVPPLQKIGRLVTMHSRIDNFFNPEENTKKRLSDTDYQSYQAQVAITRGQLTGVGIGGSTQRNHLPYCYSDFIFAIIIEETGLLFGGLIIVMSFMILFYRCIAVAFKYLSKGLHNDYGGPDLFVPLMVIGLTSSFTTQAIFHMFVNIGIAPVTGQTLPLVSHGGTSLWLTSLGIGIIIGASYRATPEGENAPFQFGLWWSNFISNFDTKRAHHNYDHTYDHTYNNNYDNVETTFNENTQQTFNENHENEFDNYNNNFDTEYKPRSTQRKNQDINNLPEL